MSERDTPAPAVDLDAIEKRANAATPGPWAASDFEVYPSEAGGEGTTCDGGCDGGCDDDPRAPIQCARVQHATETICDVYGLQQFAAQDGAFIAHARTDVPALVQLARQQAKEIERLRALVLWIRNETEHAGDCSKVGRGHRSACDCNMAEVDQRIDAALKESP